MRINCYKNSCPSTGDLSGSWTDARIYYLQGSGLWLVRPEKKSTQFSTNPDDAEEKDNHFFVQMHVADRQLAGGGGGSHQAGLLTVQKISTTASIMPMPKFQIKFLNAAWQNIERIADYYLNGL